MNYHIIRMCDSQPMTRTAFHKRLVPNARRPKGNQGYLPFRTIFALYMIGKQRRHRRAERMAGTHHLLGAIGFGKTHQQAHNIFFHIFKYFVKSCFHAHLRGVFIGACTRKLHVV